MAKRLRKQTVSELLGDNGVFAVWDRPDGIALILAQEEDGVGLSNFLEVAHDVDWHVANEDLVCKLATAVGRLAAAAGVELGDVGKAAEAGFDEWSAGEE